MKAWWREALGFTGWCLEQALHVVWDAETWVEENL